MIRYEDIPASILEDIRRHARASYAVPEESCGFLLDVKGEIRYLQATNLSPEPDTFLIPPTEYHRAANTGDLLAIVHSHNEGSGEMSELDWQVCNRSGLAWLIVQMPTEKVKVFYPMDQRELYVGRAFEYGVIDMHTLVQDYYENEFNLHLDTFPRPELYPPPGEPCQLLEVYRAMGFKPIRKDAGLPLENDVILMQHRAPVWNHVGILTAPGKVLHHPPHLRSRVSVYGRPMIGATGYYLRHEELC